MNDQVGYDFKAEEIQASNNVTDKLNEVSTSIYQSLFVKGYAHTNEEDVPSHLLNQPAFQDGMNARAEDDYNRLQAKRLELAKWNRELAEGK